MSTDQGERKAPAKKLAQLCARRTGVPVGDSEEDQLFKKQIRENYYKTEGQDWAKWARKCRAALDDELKEALQVVKTKEVLVKMASDWYRWECRDGSRDEANKIWFNNLVADWIIGLTGNKSLIDNQSIEEIHAEMKKDAVVKRIHYDAAIAGVPDQCKCGCDGHWEDWRENYCVNGEYPPME